MTALEDGELLMLARADGYPESLHPSGPLALLPDIASTPVASTPAVLPDAPARARKAHRWPLFLIASPAAVAIWSGWVALGGKCGFGPVNLLPGIGSGFTINTAITLPVGVEAYGAYALGAWLHPGTPATARRFAMYSAIGSLVLGMTGQVIYHLLAAAHAAKAPWPVVVVVACMPVATLGFGAALMHLTAAGEVQPGVPEVHPATAPGVQAEPVPETAPAGVPGDTPGTVATAPGSPPAGTRKPPADRTRTDAGKGAPATPRRLAPVADPGSDAAAEVRYAALLAEGKVPSLRAVKADMRVGQDRAREICAHLATLTRQA